MKVIPEKEGLFIEPETDFIKDGVLTVWYNTMRMLEKQPKPIKLL
jgi:hypothetical protein